MIDRRRLLVTGGAAISSALLSGQGWASPAGSLKVASLKFGSLSWLLETIRAEGIDAKSGLRLEIIDVATNHAGPVALLANEADIIVSDWTWAMRQRAKGDKLKFAPYSSALGALMVPKDSPVKSIADLQGKKLGVAGTAIDKSWLLLRAYGKKTLGRDMAEVATPVFGAAPLLTEEIKNGRLDAVLNFWTFAARLKGAGYRQILGVGEIFKELGIEPVPPLVGFIWKEETAATKGKEIAAFLSAANEANAILASSDLSWERIKGLVRAADDTELAAMKAYYRSGITRPWSAAETASAEKLTALLIEAGDKELMGAGTTFDAKLFHIPG